MFFLNSLIWLAEKVNEVVDQEVSNEDAIKEQLMKLQMVFELDQISEEEYKEREKEILEQLDRIKKSEEEEE